MKKLLLVLAIFLLLGASCNLPNQNNQSAKDNEQESVIDNDDIIDNLVEKRLQESNEKDKIKEDVESKFCNTDDDCIIVVGGNKSCSSRAAFNKDALEAQEKYKRQTRSMVCMQEFIPPDTTPRKAVCENHQCVIK